MVVASVAGKITAGNVWAKTAAGRIRAVSVSNKGANVFECKRKF